MAVTWKSRMNVLVVVCGGGILIRIYTHIHRPYTLSDWALNVDGVPQTTCQRRGLSRVPKELPFHDSSPPFSYRPLRREGVWRSECISPHFLDLGTSWRWVVSFTLPLYPRGKSSRSPLFRRMSGLQSRSRRRGEEKILDPTGTQTPTPRSSSP
jgi:hypothetical protein